MEEKVLKKLEFDKVREMLADRAASAMGKELCRELVPSTDLWEIKRMLQETDEAFSLLMRYGDPSFGGLRDIRPVLQRSAVQGLLSMGELLEVADTLRTVRRIRDYGVHKEEGSLVLPMLDPMLPPRVFPNLPPMAPPTVFPTSLPTVPAPVLATLWAAF